MGNCVQFVKARITVIIHLNFLFTLFISPIIISIATITVRSEIMKKKIAVSLIGAALLLAPIQSSYAEAQPKSYLSQEDEVKARSNMTYLGIDQKTQDRLVQKMKNGQLLDSDNPDKLRDVDHKIFLTKPGEVHRHVFEDGSVVETSLSGGTSTCGTGYCMYDGVTVGRYTTSVTATFRASYTITQGKQYADRIRSVSLPYVSGVGEFLNVSLTLPIPEEVIGTVSYAAEGSMQFDHKIGLDGVSYTNRDYLKLYVGQDMAWQDDNF
jgi:multisubunit Na+/H+ antiporter MnhC subunit